MARIFSPRPSHTQGVPPKKKYSIDPRTKLMVASPASESRAVFGSLKEGSRVKVTQQVRVGLRSWKTEASGTVVESRRVQTGLHVDRANDDPVFTDAVLLKRDDGELTTVTLDENTKIEVLSEARAHSGE